MTRQQGTHIVLQCPNCGARAGLQAGKTQCSQPGHPPMEPVWSMSGKMLTEPAPAEQSGKEDASNGRG